MPHKLDSSSSWLLRSQALSSAVVTCACESSGKEDRTAESIITGRQVSSFAPLSSDLPIICVRSRIALFFNESETGSGLPYSGGGGIEIDTRSVSAQRGTRF